MESDVLKYSTSNGIATIMLNRPDSLNSFNLALRQDLLKALQMAEADKDIRVIVLKGEGRGFCAGADLGEGLEKDVEAMLVEEYKPFLMAIAESRKVCIAQVHGSAAGIGGALAMVCDYLIMADDAYLYLAFAAIGLIPDGGLTWHMVHAMGYRKAYETIIEGQKIPANECLELRIANQIVPLAELDSAVMERATKIAAGAPLAQAAAKSVLRQVERMNMADAISLEAKVQQPLTESDDCRNAVDAFFRKEKPMFAGK